MVPNRRGIPPQGGISWVQGRNFHFVVKLPTHCECCIFLSLQWSFQLYHFICVCYLMDYHTFLLTNFGAMIWQQIVFVPHLLIKLLSSIKTTAPIVVNRLRTRTRGGMKSSEMSNGRNASKMVGNHWSIWKIFQDWGCVVLREINVLLKICDWFLVHLPCEE